jgi:transcription antitermination factor NusG
VISEAATHWYAVFTRSNFEKRVAADLASRQLDCFLPLVHETHQWKDRRKVVDVPVFPGYVFVHMPDREQTRLAVLRTNGTVRILGHGSSIEPIPDVEIESIRLLLQSGVPFVSHPFLREGARVRVRRGVLKDLEGVLVRFKNRTRLVVSVDLLARSVALEIDAGDAETL